MGLNQMYYRVSVVGGILMALAGFVGLSNFGYQSGEFRQLALMGGVNVLGLFFLAKGLKRALARPWAVRCPFLAAFLVVAANAYVIGFSWCVGGVLDEPKGNLLHAPILLVMPFGLFLWTSVISFPLIFGLWLGFGILFYALKRRYQEAV